MAFSPSVFKLCRPLHLTVTCLISHAFNLWHLRTLSTFCVARPQHSLHFPVPGLGRVVESTLYVFFRVPFWGRKRDNVLGKNLEFRHPYMLFDFGCPNPRFRRSGSLLNGRNVKLRAQCVCVCVCDVRRLQRANRTRVYPVTGE